ncbi:hypothetical protein [Azotobacter beijerinckii]|uniref:hypothetical protein n=1 Tax=Azotobacter beijerinckii TaxID=170623 RepID=UPI00111406DC|nr:hypothetical protein [Azotobacter beijerinckii]
MLFFIVVVTGEDSVEKVQKAPLRGRGCLERKGESPMQDAGPRHDQDVEMPQTKPPRLARAILDIPERGSARAITEVLMVSSCLLLYWS